MRGEHGHDFNVEQYETGSSPHARGTRDDLIGKERGHGIIPACAGNTVRRHSPFPAVRDHPRMRGEHRSSSVGGGVVVGSSPHARGTQCGAIVFHVDHGIIPACAGNTMKLIEMLAVSRDHPRMRGEHGLNHGVRDSRTGSSPHARGTRLSIRSGSSRKGIIPACAGNTPVRYRRQWRQGDHPRMRGEHPKRQDRKHTPAGSSPHARGTQHGK